MERKLKAALVGVGSMGRGHLDNYVKFLKEDSPIQIVALCDVDEKKFTNYKADFNLGEVGADFTTIWTKCLKLRPILIW